MKIRAAVLEAPGQPFQVQEVDLQEPQAGEVLVKVQAVGVCHSDWHLVTGDTKHPMPLVAGHEGSGVVAALGSPHPSSSSSLGLTGPLPQGERGPSDSSKLRIGEQVALSWAPSCGACFYCLHGRPSLCETYVEPIWAGTMLDGTTRLSRKGQPLYHYSALACFAEYCVVPEVCCVPIRSDVHVPPEIAAVIGCAVMTGVGSVLNTAKVPPGSSVVVIGAGGVGLATIMGARLAGASPILVIEKKFYPRGQDATAAGADHALWSVPKNWGSMIKRILERGADFVFECVGKPELQELALELARPGGSVVLSGLSPVSSSTNIPGATLVRQEKTVMGSYYGTGHPARDFPLFIELWKEHRLPLQKLIGKKYPLEQINEAYADMLEGKSRRGVIVFE